MSSITPSTVYIEEAKDLEQIKYPSCPFESYDYSRSYYSGSSSSVGIGFNQFTEGTDLYHHCMDGGINTSLNTTLEIIETDVTEAQFEVSNPPSTCNFELTLQIPACG